MSARVCVCVCLCVCVRVCLSLLLRAAELPSLRVSIVVVGTRRKLKGFLIDMSWSGLVCQYAVFVWLCLSASVLISPLLGLGDLSAGEKVALGDREGLLSEESWQEEDDDGQMTIETWPMNVFVSFSGWRCWWEFCEEEEKKGNVGGGGGDVHEVSLSPQRRPSSSRASGLWLRR